MRTTELPVVSTAEEILVNAIGGTARLPIGNLFGQALIGPSFSTPSEASQSLNFAEGTSARIFSVTPGVYRKSGPAGAGAWTYLGPLPTGDVSAVANQIAAEAAERQAADNALAEQIIASNGPSQDRPGDAISHFAAGIYPSPALPGSAVTFNQDGAVVRVMGAGVVAQRSLVPFEPGRVYALTFAVRRTVGSSDPANDAVRMAIAWYDQAKNRLATNATSVVSENTGLTVASGRRIVTAVVSDAAGPGVTVVAPATARYVNAYIQTFGTSPTTDIELIRWQDITDVEAWSPDVAALTGRVTTIEGQNLGPRVTTLETSVSAPNAQRYLTLPALRAATVPASVQAVELLSGETLGDGFGALYLRTNLTPAPSVRSADGAYWRASAAAGDSGSTFNTPIETTVYPLGSQEQPANTTRMTLYKAVVPGIVNSAGGNDTQEFSIGVTSGKWDQGPTGHADYTDQVFGIGWNMGPAFTPLDPAKPSTSFRIESKFAQGSANSAFGSEIHMSEYPTDSGIDRRYFSAFMPHRDADAHESSVLLAARRIDLQDYGGVQTVTFDFAAARRVTYYNLETFFTVNNKPVARQMDSTGTTSVALPYIDASNSMAVSAPITSPAPVGALAGNSQGLTVQSKGATASALTVESPHAGSSQLTFSCGTTQAASSAFTVVANGTTTFTFAAGAVTAADLNRTITGANVPASTTITELTTTTSAKASQVLPANVTSITKSARTKKSAAFAVDGSGNLVFTQSTTAGGALYADVRGSTGGFIVRDADAGQTILFQAANSAVVANRPFRPGTYTLATLPTASSFAGHLIWVSDATGGAKLCVSDGAAWKVVSLGSTVS